MRNENISTTCYGAGAVRNNWHVKNMRIHNTIILESSFLTLANIQIELQTYHGAHLRKNLPQIYISNIAFVIRSSLDKKDIRERQA